MRNGMDLMNKPVIADDGGDVECVKGLILNPEHTHVVALLLNTDVDTRKARVLKIDEIKSFAESGLQVASTAAIRSLDAAPDIRLVLYPHGPMTGTKLHAGDGTEIGTVNDLIFDEATGKIEVFEISKETTPDAHFEKAEIPLHEQQQDGVIVHACNIKDPATKPHEDSRKFDQSPVETHEVSDEPHEPTRQELQRATNEGMPPALDSESLDPGVSGGQWPVEVEHVCENVSV